MDFQRRKKKLAEQVAYGVAIRRVDRPGEPFRMKYPSHRFWYADPFICTEEDQSYVFVELMDVYRPYGMIGVALVVEDEIGEFHEVLREPFHMSFPNVFRWRGTWYMLPEAHQSKQLRLYRATSFPDAWELDSVLLDDVDVVDHALYPCGADGYLVITYDERIRKNRAFHCSMATRETKEIFPAGSWCRERPGGTFYQKDGQWRHVIQECLRGVYGEFLHVYEVEHLDAGHFEECEVAEVFMKDVDVTPDNGKLQYIHTYNRDDRYEVIDIRYDKAYWDKFLIHQVHELYKHGIFHA